MEVRKRVSTAVLVNAILGSLVMVLLLGLSTAGAVEGESITLLSHTSTQAEFFRRFIPEFEKQSGIKVNMVEVPFTELGPKLMLDLAAGTGEYDVVAITNLLMYGASPYLENLEDLYTSGLLEDLPQVAIDSCTDLNGVKRGVPFFNSLVALYYRTDLFQDAGLQPPSTWEDFLQVCQKLTVDSPKGKIWGTLIEASEKSTTGAVKLLSWFHQAGGGFADEGGRPIVDCEANIGALEFVCDLVNVHHVAPPDAPSMIFEDVHNMFIQGRAATAINWQYMVSLANAPDSVVKGKFSVAPVPAGKKRSVIVDNWMFSIPSASKHKDAAKEWIKGVMSPEQQFELLKTEGLVARLSVMNDPRALEINPFIKPFVDSMSQFGVPLPKWVKLNEALLVLSSALSSAMTGVKSPAQALGDAQKEILRLVK
jgi:ABC-type glycerol-3-phosphate transport system substrate-binding protein